MGQSVRGRICREKERGEGEGEEEREQNTLRISKTQGVPLNLGLNTDPHNHKRKIVRTREGTTGKQHAKQLLEH